MLSLRFVTNKDDDGAPTMPGGGELLYLASSTSYCFRTQQELEPVMNDGCFRIELTDEHGKEIVKTWPQQGQHFAIATSTIHGQDGRHTQRKDVGGDIQFVYDFFDGRLHQIHVRFRKKDAVVASYVDRLWTWTAKKRMCGRVVDILEKTRPFHDMDADDLAALRAREKKKFKLAANAAAVAVAAAAWKEPSLHLIDGLDHRAHRIASDVMRQDIVRRKRDVFEGREEYVEEVDDGGEVEIGDLAPY